MIRADDFKNLVLKQLFIYTLFVNRLAYKQHGFTSTPKKTRGTILGNGEFS
jgi:hypothetical protein